MRTLLDSSDDELERELGEALAEYGAVFACSLQAAVRFELANDSEIEAAKSMTPTVDEILGEGKEDRRRTNLRNYFVSIIKSEGLHDPPVEFAQAARNLQSELPGDIQRKMTADRQEAEANECD